MRKFLLETLGCKLNQAESESLLRRFLAQGYQLARYPEEVDVYVLNTCTVTHIADRKARHLLRMARRSNPKALIIATGCYAQRASEEIAPLTDLILGNTEKEYLIDIAEARLGRAKDKDSIVLADKYLPWRTRSLVKIQDGCNDFCTFCVVPSVRGRERNIPTDEVLTEVKARVAAGSKEVTLTGTKIGAYRRNGADLAYLVERILGETTIERLRLSSLQPQELNHDLVKLWANGRLCSHLHVPLQSGSDEVLRRMRRQYSTTDYERAISLLRGAIPDMAITTDILVGFPGEGEPEFEESLRFCQRMGFANIHVFPYSPRPGTLAARMPHQVEPKVKKIRTEKMLALSQQSARHFREKFLGGVMPVLWEREVEKGVWSGLTANYLRVFAESKESLANQLLQVKLIGEYKLGLWGKIVG